MKKEQPARSPSTTVWLRDYPADEFRAALEGRTIVRVVQNPDTDEGLLLQLDNGTVFNVHFNSNEGGMEVWPAGKS